MTSPIPLVYSLPVPADPLSPAASPVYAQVARLILDQVAGGQLQRGARLPSERVLCSRLGVSRVTLRRALTLLVDEGVVESAHGRGWFVTTGVLGEPPNALRSFNETARIRGLEPSAGVLLAHARAASLDEAERIGVAPGSELFELRRVRRLDGIPVAWDQALVPLGLVPRIGDVDFTVGSLYEELERAGMTPVRADYAVEALGADEHTAELLGLPIGSAVLKTNQTAFTATDRIVEVGSTIYRGDRYRFRASLFRPIADEHP